MSTLLILLTFLMFVIVIISAVALIITGIRKKDTVSKWKKRTLISFAVFVVCFAFAMQNTPKPQEQTATPAQEEQAQTAKQAAPVTHEDAIKQTAEGASSGMTVKGVETAKNDDGTYSVIVMLAAGENASDRAALNQWQRVALAEQKALYTSDQGKDLQKVIVQVYADFKSKDGSVNNNVAYWAAIDKDKASGIDWNNVKDIDKVAETYLHPSLRKSLNK